MNEFFELSIVVLIATLVAFAMRMLRQPIVIGYILAGVLAGPVAFNVIHSEETIHLFSKLGITILLFIVGLGLNPQAIREVGRVAVLGGVGQIVLTTAIGYGLALLLGLSSLHALYVSLALTFSSTIIILKLLSDKGDMHKLYGKISLGFLVIQDLVATFVLVGVTTFSGPVYNSALQTGLLLGAKSIALAAGLYLISRYLLKRIARMAAKSQELLYLFSIAWGFGLAGLFAVAGFSVEIGALVAGITLSTTAYASEIRSRLCPLRDFFIMLFFILLGSQINPASAVSVLPQALVLSLFVLVGNPLIVILLMRKLGYRKRTSFQAGVTIAQISEFSLILATLGLAVGHLTPQIVSLVTVVGLITITGSTYMILYADKLYPLVSRFLSPFEKAPKAFESTTERHYDAVLFGFNRAGTDFVQALHQRNFEPLVVDYDPASIERLAAKNISHRFGDAADLEFLLSLEFEQVRLIVSTLPDYESNVLVLRTVRRHAPDAVVICLAYDSREALKLYKEGATYVLMPHYIGAEFASKLIRQHGDNPRSYQVRRQHHLAALRQRIDHDLAGALIDDLKPELPKQGHTTRRHIGKPKSRE